MSNVPIAPCSRGCIEVARIILLDAGVVGLFCASPGRPGVHECQAWADAMNASGCSIVVAEVTYFEVKRGLLWNSATAKLDRLNQMFQFRVVNIGPVTFAAWDQAAEFWALLRQTGQPTAGPQALDADAILAAVAVTILQPGDSATIATTNVRHLNRFPDVDARLWTRIT